MRLNYKFSNLCGVSYKKGNLIYTSDGTGLFSPVGRRVSFFDLANEATFTFPFELEEDIEQISISPNGALLLAADGKGHAVLCSIPRRLVLHKFSFPDPLNVISFSPDGQIIAMAFGQRIKIWKTPVGEEAVEFAPLALIHTFTGHSEEIITLDWCLDSRYLISASSDMTARVFDVKKNDLNPNFRPLELRAHRHPLVGAYFSADSQMIYTVARNGGVFLWRFHAEKGILLEMQPVRRFQMKTVAANPEDEAKYVKSSHKSEEDDANDDVNDTHKSKITTLSYNKGTNMIVAGFANGVFVLYVIKPFEMLYSLGVTQCRLTSVAINQTGEWIAMGIAEMGQLLVWEWRTETFILRQQGNRSPMTCLAYSGDGQIMATGSTDGKVKLWNSANGMSFVTFSDHAASISGVHFTRNGKVLISASNDGTVRAHDLIRFRNFRTFTTPSPVQFLSLTVDPSGEVIAAGTLDTFEIFVWSMQTGQLLEVIGGHTGPVADLAFDPTGTRLASASWDRSARVWNIFERDKKMEVFDHASEVLSIDFRQDGQELATCTLRGELYLWNIDLASINASIDCRRDYAEKPLSTASLKSICYSPDGNMILTSGSFPYIGLYDVSSRILLRRFPLTKMRRDQPEQTAEIDVSSVKFSPTGRSFSAQTSSGIFTFSLL